jgi:hypothetical protein
MSSQLITEQDRENYGGEFIDFSRRAAYDAVAPALQQLQAENQQLRGMAQRSQRAEIERALDQAVPNWHDVYNDARFSSWLQSSDGYNDGPRSQMLRQAVAAGDARRVVRFYQGFLAEAGHHAPPGQSRASQSRSPQASSGAILTRPQIAALYERRRKGEFNDAQWAQIEPAIFNAANQGRIAGALDRDGNKLSELR